MASKRTKKQIAERDALAADLRLVASRLAIAITDYNETLSTVTDHNRARADRANAGRMCLIRCPAFTFD